MKKIAATLALVLSGLSLGACTHINSAQSGWQSTTGEGWYTKATWFIIPISQKVFYCDGKTNVCQEATIK
jgi:hypothetical protein